MACSLSGRGSDDRFFYNVFAGIYGVEEKNNYYGKLLQWKLKLEKDTEVYLVEEIQNKIPDNLLINWYWIGSSGKGDTATLTPDTQYGLKSYEDGKLTEKDFLQFSSNLKTALNKGYISDKVETTYQNGKTVKIDSKEEVEDYLSNSKDFRSAKFSGVILTGRAESFAQLENKDWIYASNIGQSVIIQPYHTLTK